MANGEHVEILRKGVGAWNAWRAAHPDITPDLSGADLSEADLSGTILTEADLRRANLSEAILSEADLSGANLRGANLSEARLFDADLSFALVCDADLTRAFLDKANLIETNLSRASLIDADFIRTPLRGVDLSGANLHGANLSQADLSGAKLTRANLTATCLTGANLDYANFKNATLANADLQDGSVTIEKKQYPFTKTEKKPTTVAGLFLGGADLTNAKLPDSLSGFETLGVAEETSKNARKIFVSLLLGCAYSWLTIFTTKDVDLLLDSTSSPLPIIRTPIPVFGFYIVAPLLLLGLFLYQLRALRYPRVQLPHRHRPPPPPITATRRARSIMRRVAGITAVRIALSR